MSDRRRHRCPAHESGGFRCELPPDHDGDHWISDRTIRRASPPQTSLPPAGGEQEITDTEKRQQ